MVAGPQPRGPEVAGEPDGVVLELAVGQYLAALGHDQGRFVGEAVDVCAGVHAAPR
ncbi:Uncharacterised protein [Mycobacteroides abscessus subsp. abscessus]|nr:Uncharacterised protein [Mycobacteroides abscessus subsp. abscessus]